ncbi:GNAT family N-acetyltransferase [Acetobacter cerevisiae]|uniref:GNAT family N-acetyltransferase n=1 Tax=Acetobacter cerevisiae TaxID=178900 RepID=A0ABT1EWK0_9PROT|nr:GNAT family N-acetyltransferase [Acetobacter cerevisiae]MCP1246744.1 GNAT family N-acetyltransferase [Acetobacter cerevisiae]MCP1256288.1 GNAT family N-acetyltransferase [Acetobacter cerevisiae]
MACIKEAVSDFLPIRDYQIIPLSRQVLREGFSCGREKIDNFFLKSALEKHNKNQVKVHVAVINQDDDIKKSIGFYSVCVRTIGCSKFIQKIKRLFKAYGGVPVVYLSMIGVTEEYSGRGVGSFLLADALDRSLRASKDIGIHGVALDAATDELVAFYSRFGFKLLQNAKGERTMFISCAQIEDAISKA